MNLGRKILVVGANGSGKTTFGKKLSVILNIPFYELDDIFWQPNWQEPDKGEFKARVEDVALKDKWITDGNYKNTIEVRLNNADSVIWLDYKMPKVLYRVFKRTLARVITQETLWKNNTQSFRKAFHPKESIILYSLKTFKRKSNFIFQKMNSEEYKILNWHRITCKKDEAKFWESVVFKSD